MRHFLISSYILLLTLARLSSQAQTSDPFTDLDGNGLWDTWETEIFSTTGIDPESDHDGDGQTASEEMLAGTNPLDAASHFKLSLSRGDQGREISFTPLVNKRQYSVLRSDSPSPSTSWNVLRSGTLESLGDPAGVIDTDDTHDRTFYRILIESIKQEPEEALVVCYPFDGDANDQSGNELHGDIHGASLAPDRFGIADSAYYFDGSSYITVSGDDALLNVNADGWTLSFWVHPDAEQDSASVPILSYGYGRNGGYNIAYWHQYGMYRTDFYDYSWSGSYIGQDNLDDDLWYMYSITYDGEIIRQYVNGVLVSQKTGAYNPTSPEGAFSLRLGADSASANTFFKGSLDDIHIYYRALSDLEIALMSGLSGAVRATELDAYSLADFERGILTPAKCSNYWAVWGNDSEAYTEVVPNPLKSGANPSNYVAVSHTFRSNPLPDQTDCQKSEYMLSTADGLATDQHHIMKWKLLFTNSNIVEIEDIVWDWMSFNQIHTGAAKYPNGPGTTETDDTIAEGGGIYNDLVKSHTDDPSLYRFRYRAIPDDETVPFNINIGQWMSFTYEIFWTQSDTGYWRIWKDGELLAYADNVKTLPDSYDPATDDFLQFKTGLYNKWDDPQIERLSLYFDDLELYIGEDIRVEDVAPECDLSPLIAGNETPTSPPR